MRYWDGLFYFDGETIITNFTGLIIFLVATQLGTMTLAFIIAWALCTIKHRFRVLNRKVDWIYERTQDNEEESSGTLVYDPETGQVLTADEATSLVVEELEQVLNQEDNDEV